MKFESQSNPAVTWPALLVFVCLAWFSPAGAQDQSPRLYVAKETSLVVPLYKSRIVKFAGPAARVSVGSPDIADLIILRSNQLYVLGKDLGTTNVLLWDRSDNLIGTINVEVSHDLQSLKEKLYRLLPQEKIEVYSAQRNIVLAGHFSNLVHMNAAVRIAEGYFSQLATAVETETFEPAAGATKREDKSVGEVINLMNVGGVHQVMLEVIVAEIQRSELKRLDVRFNTILTGSSKWTWGAVNGGSGNELFIEDKGFFASFLSENALFNLAFDAAQENGLAKILAEPTLVTQSGHEAQFLSGGEFPIPVPSGLQGTTIEFKEFGIGIRFLPLVLDSKRISLKLNISVSELVNDNSVIVSAEGVSSTFLIPSLSIRSAQSTVELADGQTIGIAGLINENLREVVTKFPGLGSIPVLGALFRSQEFIKNETELLILVTPHLAKPLLPSDVQLPTDNIVEAGDFGWWFQGKLQGRVSGSGGDKIKLTTFSQFTEQE